MYIKLTIIIKKNLEIKCWLLSFIITTTTVEDDEREFLYEKIDKKKLYRLGRVKEFIPTKSSGIVNGIIVIKI